MSIHTIYMMRPHRSVVRAYSTSQSDLQPRNLDHHRFRRTKTQQAASEGIQSPHQPIVRLEEVISARRHSSSKSSTSSFSSSSSSLSTSSSSNGSDYQTPLDILSRVHRGFASICKTVVVALLVIAAVPVLGVLVILATLCIPEVFCYVLAFLVAIVFLQLLFYVCEFIERRRKTSVETSVVETSTTTTIAATAEMVASSSSSVADAAAEDAPPASTPALSVADLLQELAPSYVDSVNAAIHSLARAI